MKSALTDTSSSNPHPLNGATAGDPGASQGNGFSASGPVSATPRPPRQGWWKRTAADAGESGTPLVQIGDRVPKAVKTTAPDVVVDDNQSTAMLSPAPVEGGRGSESGENKDQDVVDPGGDATNPAPPPNGFEGLGLARKS